MSTSLWKTCRQEKTLPDELTVWQCRPELVSAPATNELALHNKLSVLFWYWVYLQSIDSVPFLVVVVHQIHDGLC